MRRPFRIVVILAFAASANAAEVQLIPQGDKLSTRDMRRIERVLTKDFPVKMLRKRAGGGGKAAISRVVYFPLRQRSKQYILSVSSAKWSNYAARFSVYRIYRDSIVRIYTSRSWQANYPVYTFEALQTGKETILLFKEGVEDESMYALASVLNIAQGKNGFYIRDITPSFTGLAAKVEFPFKPLYAKSIRLISKERLSLTASHSYQATSYWEYDAKNHKLIFSDNTTAVTSTDIK